MASAGEDTNAAAGGNKMDIEREEEKKLLSKYPNMNRPLGGAMGGRGGGRGGHSAFLQKRLAKGQKFFDSGDYQMAKQKNATSSRLAAATCTQSTFPPPSGAAEQTPAIKANAASTDPSPAASSFGRAIPTPETVPARKTSIIQPPLRRELSTPQQGGHQGAAATGGTHQLHSDLSLNEQKQQEDEEEEPISNLVLPGITSS